MMLWQCEVKKMLLTHKGLWILLVCLVLKLAFLWVFPEQKDSRILLSQKQYDKFLLELHGENTPEKSNWILSEYESYKQIRDSYQEMQEQYARGEITEEEWNTYTQALNQADLKINSAAIFAEKAEQFLEQPEDLPPAHYIYEYGWQTVFTLLRFPDVFLLVAVLLLSAQCFSAEAAGGMLPVLLAARRGRRQLFAVKLLALLAVCLGGCVLSGWLEWAVFARRGWLNDGGAPLYSVTWMRDCPLELTLEQGYGLCLAVRTLAALLFAVMIFGLSVWIRGGANLIFTGLCLLALPLLWDGPAALFTYSGLLCGSGMLLWLGQSGMPLAVPLAVTGACSAAAAFFGAKRHDRGI